MHLTCFFTIQPKCKKSATKGPTIFSHLTSICCGNIKFLYVIKGTIATFCQWIAAWMVGHDRNISKRFAHCRANVNTRWRRKKLTIWRPGGQLQLELQLQRPVINKQHFHPRSAFKVMSISSPAVIEVSTGNRPSSVNIVAVTIHKNRPIF